MAAVTDDAVATGEELVTDKGYHSTQQLVELQAFEVRTYISEPDRKPARLDRSPHGTRRRLCQSAKAALAGNDSCGAAANSHAHLYETGRMRRTPLRGHVNILKRLLVHAIANSSCGA